MIDMKSRRDFGKCAQLSRCAALFVVAAIAGIAIGPQPARAQLSAEITIGAPPPPMRVEPVPVPVPGYVWAPGYWAWDGREYVWYQGHWEYARPEEVYVGAGWVQTPVGWRFMPAHWDHGRHEGWEHEEHEEHERWEHDRGHHDR